MTQNQKTLLGGAIIIAVLIGAFFAFQYRSAAPAISNVTASSTPGTALATSTPEPSSLPAVYTDAPNPAPTPAPTPSKDNAFDMTARVTGLSIGSQIPPISFTLSAGSRGKTLEIALVPVTGTISSLPKDILMAVPVTTDGTAYTVTGLKLSTVTVAGTGAKEAVTPGTYMLEAILWDRNPFTASATYGNVQGNSATAVVSDTFTLK